MQDGDKTGPKLISLGSQEDVEEEVGEAGGTRQATKKNGGNTTKGRVSGFGDLAFQAEKKD